MITRDVVLRQAYAQEIRAVLAWARYDLAMCRIQRGVNDDLALSYLAWAHQGRERARRLRGYARQLCASDRGAPGRRG